MEIYQWLLRKNGLPISNRGCFWILLDLIGWGAGGGERDRTADLYVANVALSQLSYTPMMP